MESVNIDYLKWKFEKAGEPFEVCNYPNCTTVQYPGKEHAVLIEDFEKECPDYVKSLLLQRAIEGVNMDRMYEIEQLSHEIDVVYKGLLTDFQFTDSTDSAKESALQYVYEQETKWKA
jgi:hypothetical protein